ncbi:MAG: amidohydrolase family protein [Firmicutes bacterium]|nr:amidohydrolase family protein [Bacillota bacterium]
MGRFYECHGHVMMRTEDYRASLERMSSFGISYFRDGGDAEGRTAEAKRWVLEHPELGIEYVTPVFATHRKGRYGDIVGRPFGDYKEFRSLIKEAASLGADFVKIMFSGIVTFKAFGELSCPPLEAGEIKELVNIAHGEGFAVMAHTNGKDAFMAAVEAGTDSIEHGVFIDEECLQALAESGSIWVPTLAAIIAFSGRSGSGDKARYTARPGFDAEITRLTAESHMASVRRGAELGAKIAAGSDSGAFGVPAGSGTLSEYALLWECGVPAESVIAVNELIRGRFRR